MPHSVVAVASFRGFEGGLFSRRKSRACGLSICRVSTPFDLGDTWRLSNESVGTIEVVGFEPTWCYGVLVKGGCEGVLASFRARGGCMDAYVVRRSK
jgi:hypothetical protein